MANDESQFPWPGNSDRPFVPPKAGAIRPSAPRFGPEPGWMLEYEFRQGYYEAGVTLAQRLNSPTRESRVHPGIALPMLFCFRHYLELTLKSLITWMCELTDQPLPVRASDRCGLPAAQRVGACRLAQREESVLEIEHGIMPLWNIAKPLMAKGFSRPATDDPLRNVERCLNDFHQVDGNSQTFRYHRDKSGRLVDEKFPHIELDQLLTTMAGLHSFFTGCEYEAENLLSLKADIAAEYADFDRPDWE